MITVFQILLLSILILCALSVWFLKDTLTSVIVYMSFSTVTSIVWILLESPDLALTEAAVGSGVTSLLFFITLKKIDRIDISLNTINPDLKKQLEIGIKTEKEIALEEKRKNRTFGQLVYKIIGILATISLISAMIYAITFLPRFGDASQNPTLNEVFNKYIQDGIKDTGATNFVTGMILDYRAFDTLGESFVLFTAISCVLVLLQGYKDKGKNKEIFKVFTDPILSNVSSILVPIILLFGSYIILNGSISPGGGFSGGAIMGAGLILYSLAFGFKKSGDFFKDKTFKLITSISLLAYCGCKTYSFFTGANGMHSIIPLGTPGAILSGGIIFILNLSVGLIVTCTMFGFYSLFRRGKI